MTVVALTGGIAAGKTTVTDVLSRQGIAVVDADSLARQAVAPGSPALERIVSRFGPAVVDEAGQLKRDVLGSLVFGDSQAREDLNAIVHPEVRRLSHESFASHTSAHPDVPLVYAVPLLAESSRADEFDLVVVVDAPREQRIRRLVENRELTREEATRRVDAQASDEQRLALADVVLDASSDRESTVQAALELATELWECWPDRLDRIPPQLPSSPG